MVEKSSDAGPPVGVRNTEDLRRVEESPMQRGGWLFVETVMYAEQRETRLVWASLKNLAWFLRSLSNRAYVFLEKSFHSRRWIFLSF